MHLKAVCRRRGVAVTGLATAIALAASACGSNSSSGGGSGGSASGKLPAQIPVTAVQDVSGSTAYVGNSTVAGMKTAIKQINGSNLLHGSKLVLTVKDTASTVGQATTQFSQAVNSKAVAILGPLLSQEAQATAPLAQRAKVVDIAIESQSDTLLATGNYIYRATASQLRFDNLIPDYVAPRQSANKTMRILYLSDTPTLVEATKQLEKKFASLGVKTLGTVGVPITTTDFGSIATKLEAGNPGSIGIMVIGAANSSAISALRDSGYKGVIWAEEAATNGALSAAGQKAKGTVYTVDYNPGLKFPSARKFTKLFKADNPGKTPNGYNATGYDAINELAHAIALSGDASRDGVQKGMQMLVKSGGVNGAIGPEKFTGTGNRDLSVAGTLVKWNGSKEVIVKVGNPKLTTQP